MTSTALWLAFGSMAFVLVVVWAIHKLAKHARQPLATRPQYGVDDHFSAAATTGGGAHGCGADGGSCDGGGGGH